MDKELKVFICDDDAFFRKAIQLIVDDEPNFTVIGTAENGVEALRKIRESKPDVVLMDVQMPKMNGIECIRYLKQDFPDMPIVILTTFNEEEYIVTGLANGANGYIVKGIDFHILIDTMRALTKGQYMLPIEVATKLAKYTLSKLDHQENVLPDFITSSNTFTNKECEIVALLAKRLTNKEIAQKLFISEGTLRNYMTTIYEKLDVKNRNEAITLLLQQGE